MPAAAREFVRRRGAPIVVKADGLAARQGRGGRADRGRGGGGDRRLSARRGGWARPGAAGDRGMPGGRGGQPVRPLRRRARDRVRGGARPQARGRGRHRAEHRRHGRDQPAARLRPRASRRRRWQRIVRPALARDGAARHAVPRLPVRRPDADRGRAEADRVQRPPRRSGGAVPAAAACSRTCWPPCWPRAMGSWRTFDLRWREVATLAVVMAAKGYPGGAGAAPPIGGLAAAEAVADALVFHAGTAARGRAAGLGRRAGADGVRQRRRISRRPTRRPIGPWPRSTGRTGISAATSAGAHLQRRGLAPRAELAYSRRVRRGVEVMELDRRRFLKLSGATLAASSIGALGLRRGGRGAGRDGAAVQAGTHHRDPQHLHLLRGRLRHPDLQPRRPGEERPAEHHPYRGRPGPPGEPRHAVPEGRGAARRGAFADAAEVPDVPRARRATSWKRVSWD